MLAYPAARANSAAALSAALFLRILFILETLGAVLFVHTPEKYRVKEYIKMHDFTRMLIC